MPRFKYAKAQNTGEKLITKFGYSIADNKAFILRKGANTGTDFNPVYGDDVEIAVSAVRDPDGFKLKDIDGTSILMSDAKIIVAGNGEEPTKDDKFKYNNDIYEIIDIDPMKPKDTTVIFTLACRN